MSLKRKYGARNGREASSSFEEDHDDFGEEEEEDSDDDDHGLRKGEKKYEVMDEDDIEGQEEATIEFDGGIRITPFNMKEELEEGHFDKDGNYFLNKDEEIKDGWLDNIDWVKVEHSKGVVKEGQSGDEEEEEEEEESVDEVASYQKMTELMQPGETVLRAIQRLGRGGAKKGGGAKRSCASSRWAQKKEEEACENEEAKKAKEEEKAKMLRLTELADRLLASGKTEIYNQTYEKIAYRLQQMRKKEETKKEEEEDVLDMFGEDFDEKAEQKKKKKKEEEEMEKEEASTSQQQQDTDDDRVKWEFKWENSEGSAVYGPHSSDEMQGWVDSGYFSDGVWVRRTDQPEAHFYSSKRVDFELYS